MAEDEEFLTELRSNPTFRWFQLNVFYVKGGPTSPASGMEAALEAFLILGTRELVSAGQSTAWGLEVIDRGGNTIHYLKAASNQMNEAAFSRGALCYLVQHTILPRLHAATPRARRSVSDVPRFGVGTVVADTPTGQLMTLALPPSLPIGLGA